MAKAKPVDMHVGSRMRQRRTLLGMSQSKVGEAVGLTFQQIQKYERGSNRIGSSRLYEFAKVLDVPVSYFFDEMPSNALSGRPMSGRGRKGFGEAGTPFEQEKDPLIKRETLELVRAYYKIREGRVRKRIFEMVKAMGAASHAEVLGGRKRRRLHSGKLSGRIAFAGQAIFARDGTGRCITLRRSEHCRWRHAQAGRRHLSPMGHRRSGGQTGLPRWVAGGQLGSD